MAVSVPSVSVLQSGTLTQPNSGKITQSAYKFFASLITAVTAIATDQASVIQLSRAQRTAITLPNSSYPAGTLVWEADTNWTYMVASSGSAWQVIAGLYVATLVTLQALTMSANDTGAEAVVSDYAHRVGWDGAAWSFRDDPGGRFVDCSVAPAGNGWQLCDGTATDYLTVGAALGKTAFTTPALTATPVYRKSAAAYTGTLNAASGKTADGSTGTGTTGTGTTGTGTTGTGTTGTGTTGTGSFTGQPTATVSVQSGSGATVAGQTHTHSIPGLSVPGLSVPGLSVPGLSVPELSVPSLIVAGLAVGTIDMPHLDVLPYFRR